MKAYKHLVKHAINLGYTCSVWDGEEWQVKRSTKQKDVFAAIESVEEAELRFRDNAGEIVGWAHVSAFGLDDDETVIDSTTQPWLNKWWDEYEKTQVR